MTSSRKTPCLLVWSILLGGLILSTTLICIGLAWQWLISGTLGSFLPISAMNLWEYLVIIIRTAMTGGLDSSVVVNAGIAILLLTPFVRVLGSVLFFAYQEGNRKFTVITGFVLVILMIVLFIR